MVITDEPAVQSARLLSLGPNCIQATSSTCSRYLCYSIDAESCSSLPKSSQWSKAGFGSRVWTQNYTLCHDLKLKIKVPSNKILRLTPSVNLDLITCISPFPHDLIYSPYSPKVLVFSPNARPFFPNFNSLWVQASRRDLSVVAQAFHTLLYKTYILQEWVTHLKSGRLWLTLLFSIKHSSDKSFKLFLYVSFEKSISQRVNGWV